MLQLHFLLDFELLKQNSICGISIPESDIRLNLRNKTFIGYFQNVPKSLFSVDDNGFGKCQHMLILAQTIRYCFVLVHGIHTFVLWIVNVKCNNDSSNNG